MARRSVSAIALIGILLHWAPLPAAAQQAVPIFGKDDRVHPVRARNGMVATQSAPATLAALEVLKEGGNAVDAAVTAGFALAVTLPRAGNLGGGGFMLIHLAEGRKTTALDYRETAPRRAHRDMFLDAEGNADPELSRFSPLSAGVPGTVAGLALALEKYGTITLERAIRPAIALARDGFEVNADLHDSLVWAAKNFEKSPAATEVFLPRMAAEIREGSGGSDPASSGAGSESASPTATRMPPEFGSILKQPDLARSLEQIAKHGPQAFYTGEIAGKISDFMQEEGGLIDMEDLAAYRPVFREPVRGSYRGNEILSMPPPSSGGTHLVQILNLLEPYPIGEWGPGSAQTLHAMTEAMKLAYADRSKHLGDPDFTPVPLAALISRDYANALRRGINLHRATPSTQIFPGTPPAGLESPQTTHFSVMDKHGNAVSNTYTLNFSYGSGYMVPGTGILLNNEMDDFSAKPGVPNAFGLLGGEKNAVAPGKRMLSSMSPTIVLLKDGGMLATGSPGGSRIITITLQVLMNMIDHGMNLAEATAAPRMHHQWFPDTIQVEEGFSPDTLELLKIRGQSVSPIHAFGSAQSAMRSGDWFHGASDPRSEGSLAQGY